MAINMPSLIVTVKQLAETVIQRSAQGRVVLIVVDDTVSDDKVATYQTKFDIPKETYTAANYNDITAAFDTVVTYNAATGTYVGAPKSVTVFKLGAEETFAEDIAPTLNQYRFDWITAITADADVHTAIIEYVEAYNAKPYKSAKALVYKATAPDDKHVVNFITDTYSTVSAQDQPGWHLLGRICGIAAGLPMNRTLTYYALSGIERVSEPEDMDAEVEKGHLFLWNDEDDVKLSRGVNSMTTLEGDDTEDMRSIAIIEAIDLMVYDLRTAFKNSYVGKFKNNYDNQTLYISAVNKYFQTLALDDILDRNFNNVATVDVEAQRRAWIDIGKTEANDWDDNTVKLNTFKRMVFLTGNVKILDGMEDLRFPIYMQ